MAHLGSEGISLISATDDNLLADVTAAMDLVRIPSDNNEITKEDVVEAHGIETDDRLERVTEPPRPFDLLGPPASPIPFSNRQVHFRGQRRVVACYNKSTKQYDNLDVLVRDEDDHQYPHGDVQQAYWALPYKDKIDTIMGHVQICVILRPCIKCPNRTGSHSIDEDSESENEDEDEDIIFETTTELVAIKVNYCSRMNGLRGRHAEDPFQEIAAMQVIGNQHPNVLGYIEILFDGQNLNVVMPFLNGGDLFHVLHEGPQSAIPGMQEDVARFWFRQICSGLQHLHGVGICHRDLSPENVMLDGDRACLIIDMGMALRIPYGHSVDASQVVDISQGMQRRLITPQGACGKLPYMSPEIYQNRLPFDGVAIDVWTAGTILFCMLTGNRSYQRAEKSDPQFYWMTHGLSILLADWGVMISEDAVDLLKGMLQIDPRLRLTLDEVIAHPWFSHP